MTHQEEYEIGLSFYNGDGKEKNINEAIKHFEIAANAGNLEAMNKLGIIYLDEDNYKNIELAINWLTKASEGGLIKATTNLGMVFCTGNSGKAIDVNKAFELFKQAAEKKEPNALYMLGQMYYYGEGVEKDKAIAFNYFQKAAALGDIDSLINVGRAYFSGDGVERNYERALHYLEIASLNDKCDPENWINIGYFYINGLGTPKNAKRAFECFKKAADSGIASAYNNVGSCYLNGDGCQKNEKKALEYYQRAVDSGNGMAYACIGNMYYFGLAGLEKNVKKALLYYQKAIDHGEGYGAFRIGSLYLFGRGVKQDFNKAFEFLSKAAKMNNSMAMNSLGTMYYHGNGVAQDYKKAFEWFTKAEETSPNCYAENNLAYLYYYGQGVEKDVAKAAFWFQKADELNYFKATYKLATMFSSGSGVEQNFNEAFRLFRKAALKGHAGAQVALGNAYCSGKGIKRDMSEAVFWWKKSFSLGRQDPCFNIGCACIKGEGVLRNESESLQWFQKAANIEDSDAQTLLGYALFYGKGITRDLNLALHFFTLASNAGNNLATCCLDHIRTGKSLPSINGILTYKTDYFTNSKIEVITKKAELGDTNAQSLIAHLSLTDDRISHGTKKAAAWLRKAADKGDAESLFNLAIILLGDVVVPRGYLNPLELIKASAEAGYSRAKFVMASIVKGKESEVTEEKLLELCNSPSSIEDIVISIFGDTYNQSDTFIVLFLLYITHKNITLEQSRDPHFIHDNKDSLLPLLYKKAVAYFYIGSNNKKGENLYIQLNKLDKNDFENQYSNSLLKLLRRSNVYFSKPISYPDSQVSGIVSQEMKEASTQAAICICASFELPVLYPNAKYYFRDTDPDKLLLDSIVLEAYNISDYTLSYKEPFDDLITSGFDTIICQTPVRATPRADFDIDDIQGNYINHIISKKDWIKTAIVFVDSDFCSSTVASRLNIRKYLIDNGFLKKVIEIPKGTLGDVESNSAIAVFDFTSKHTDVLFVFDSDSLSVNCETISQMDYNWNYRIYNQDVDCKDGQVVLPLKQIVSFDFNGEQVVESFIQLTRNDFSSTLLEALNNDEKEVATNSGDSTFWMKHKGPGIFFTYDGEIRSKRVSDELYYSTGNLGYFLHINDSIVDIDYVAYLILHDHSLSRYMVDISDSRGRFNYSDFLNRKIAIYTDKKNQRQIVEKALIEERQGVITQNDYSIILVSSDTSSIVLQYSNIFDKNHITIFRSADYVEDSTEGNSYVSLRELLFNKQAQTKIDAIVVDGEVKNSRTNDEFGLGLILEDYAALKKCGIPLYLFSESPVSRLGLRPGERKDIVESGRFFSKNEDMFFESMIKKIRDDIDKKDSPIIRIRTKYKKVFEAADAIDQKYVLDISRAISRFILDGCIIDENPASSTCGPFRLVVHQLIEIMQAKNLVPKLDPGAIPQLLSSNYYSDGKSGKRYYQYSQFMPKYLANALSYFITATNSGVHGSQDSSLIGHSVLNILMEFILWFHREFVVEAKYDFNIPDKYFWGVKDDYEQVQRNKEYIVSCVDNGKDKYYYSENIHLKATDGLKAGCKVRFNTNYLGDDTKPLFDNGLRVVFYANEKQYTIVPEKK